MVFNILQAITPSGISGIKIVESINNLLIPFCSFIIYFFGNQIGLYVTLPIRGVILLYPVNISLYLLCIAYVRLYRLQFYRQQNSLTILDG